MEEDFNLVVILMKTMLMNVKTFFVLREEYLVTELPYPRET